MTNFILGTLFGITATCFVKKIINDIEIEKVVDILEDIDDIDIEELLNELDESGEDHIVKTIIVKKDDEEE